jgi:hypothetical protein
MPQPPMAYALPFSRATQIDKGERRHTRAIKVQSATYEIEVAFRFIVFISAF